MSLPVGKPALKHTVTEKTFIDEKSENGDLKANQLHMHASAEFDTDSFLNNIDLDLISQKRTAEEFISSFGFSTSHSYDIHCNETYSEIGLFQQVWTYMDTNRRTMTSRSNVFKCVEGGKTPQCPPFLCVDPQC